jgi:2-keto-4-pentenoate hydratase
MRSMPDTAIRHEELAADLTRARRDRATIAPPSDRYDAFDESDAREVLRWLDRSSGHDPSSGVKIGLTFQAIWDRVGVSEPFVAPIRASGIERANVFSLRRCTSPRVEPEVVVSLRSALPIGASRVDVIDAIGTVGLGFEVVDSHYENWTARSVDLVADFGCHAGLVLGEQIDATPEILSGLAGLAVLVEGDTEPLHGLGVNVLGDPIESIVGALASSYATPLEAGALVSTGSLTGRSHPTRPDRQWGVSISAGPSLPSCTVELA